MKDYTKKNIKLLRPSATLVINEKSKELISKGKKVFKFGFGQSPFPIPHHLGQTRLARRFAPRAIERIAIATVE